MRIAAIEEGLPDTYHIPFALSLAFETLHNRAFHVPFDIYFQVLSCVGSKPIYYSSDKMWAFTNAAFSFAVSSATKGHKVLPISVPSSKE